MAVLVRQRERKDCCVAALSMATGLPYEDIRARFFARQDFSKDGEGVTENKQASVLRALGYKTRTGKEVKEGTPAIVTVKSLNIPRSYHAVYFNGSRFMDPNRGREGKKYYLDVGPEAVVSAMTYGKKDKTGGKSKAKRRRN